MTIAPETLVSEILEERPDAVAVFARHGVDVCAECAGVLENPLDLCETMCSLDDFEGFMHDLQVFMETEPANH